MAMHVDSGYVKEVEDTGEDRFFMCAKVARSKTVAVVQVGAEPQCGLTMA